MKCIFCSSELIEFPDKKWAYYYCNNCLCSYERKNNTKNSVNVIYFDFGFDLELNVPLDGDMDAYPICIEFYVENNVVSYDDWGSNLHQLYKDMTISSAEEVKDLVKRLHNLKLFI
jgi:hypothetical protein